MFCYLGNKNHILICCFGCNSFWKFLLPVIMWIKTFVKFTYFLLSTVEFGIRDDVLNVNWRTNSVFWRLCSYAQMVLGELMKINTSKVCTVKTTKRINRTFSKYRKENSEYSATTYILHSQVAKTIIFIQLVTHFCAGLTAVDLAIHCYISPMWLYERHASIMNASSVHTS